MLINEIIEGRVDPDQDLVNQIMMLVQDSIEEYEDSVDGEHDFNELEELLNSNIEDQFPVEFIVDYKPRRNKQEIVSAGASLDKKGKVHITVYLLADNLENHWKNLIPEIEKKLAHETVHIAQYKKIGRQKLNKLRSGHEKGVELAKRTGKEQDWMRNYLRDPHELQAYGRDLAQEISQTDNPEKALRNPEKYRSELPTYNQVRNVFTVRTPQVRQLLKYAAQYIT